VAQESDARLNAQGFHAILVRIACRCHRALVENYVTLPLGVISENHVHVIKVLHPAKVREKDPENTNIANDN
jgi:hypothetical protein